MNLYKEYKRLNKSKENIFSNKGLLTIFLTVVFILSLLLFGMSIQEKYLMKQTQKMEDYLESEDFLKNYKEAKRQEDALKIGRELKIKLDSINTVLHKKKSFNQEFIKDIKSQEPFGMDVQSLSYQSGRVFINYESKTVKDSLVYTENLRNIALIKDLQYQGYKRTQAIIQGQIEIVLEGGY